MTALAYVVFVDGVQYAAGTDHSTMPTNAVDQIRNPNAWVGGVAPAVTTVPDGKPWLSGADLSTAARAKKAMGIEVSLLGGHVVPTGDAPAAAVQAGAGTGATATVAGRDTAGIITLTSGSGSVASGNQVVVTFAKPFAVAPVVMTNAANAAAATGVQRYASTTTTSFTVGFGVAPATGTAYAISYVVVGK